MDSNLWSKDLRALQEVLFEALDIASSSVIEEQIDVAIDASEHGNTLSAILNLSRISRILSDLSVLEERNVAAYRALRRDLRNARDQAGHFHGTRFELSVAAQLALREIEFIKQERPDFKVGNLGVECTSCRKAGGKAEAEAKFIEAITRKNSKPYSDKAMILKVDVTNLFFHDDPKEWQALLRRLTDLAKVHVEKASFGAIGVYVFRQSQSRIHEAGYGFNTVLSDRADTELAAFLDEHYSNVGVSLRGPVIPREC